MSSCAPGAIARRVDKAEVRARELVELIGLKRYWEIETGILSYGQKKLVALAAALMPHPKIVVLDEPVAGVNPTPHPRDRGGAGRAQPRRRDLPDRRAQCRVHHQPLPSRDRRSTRAASWPKARPPRSIRDPRVLEAYLGMTPEMAEAEMRGRHERPRPRTGLGHGRLRRRPDRARILGPRCRPARSRR